jgi:hypothetical protein
MADDDAVEKNVRTWGEALAQFKGDEKKAASTYPTLDPRYQKLLKSEGEAKAIVDYSDKYVDPASGVPDPTAAPAFPGSAYSPDGGRAEGIGVVPHEDQQIKAMHEAEAAAAAGAGGDHHKPPAPPAPKPPISPAAQAANSLMQSLAGEYTGMMTSMAPYMSGSAGVQAGQSAEAMGAAAAGGGVQAQNPTYAAQLAAPQNTVAQAMQAGSKDIAQGITDLGKADEAYMQSAPYAGLLSALQSEGQYKIETGAATPNVSTTPKWAQAAYADVLGAAPAGAGSTSTPGNTQSQLAAEQAATTPSTTSSQSPGQAGGSA